jgi:hypothetical protein
MEVIKLICHLDYAPCTEVEKLLHAIVYSDLVTVKDMLDKKPELLLQHGNVETPGGDIVMDVTPYQCVLGTGDHYTDRQGVAMIPLIASYYEKIPGVNGEELRKQHSAPYEKCFDTMLKMLSNISETECMHEPEPAFKTLIDELFEVLIKSDLADATAALNKNFDAENIPLHKMLDVYRDARKPGLIRQGLHYHYENYIYVIEKLVNEDWKLINSGQDTPQTYDKFHLLWYQVCGWEQRRFPMCDRQAYAQGILHLLEGNNNPGFARTLKLEEGEGDYPITCRDNMTQGTKDRCGLGWDYAIGSYGQQQLSTPLGGTNALETLDRAYHLFQVKASTLKSYATDIINQICTVVSMKNK